MSNPPEWLITPPAGGFGAKANGVGWLGGVNKMAGSQNLPLKPTNPRCPGDCLQDASSMQEPQLLGVVCTGIQILGSRLPRKCNFWGGLHRKSNGRGLFTQEIQLPRSLLFFKRNNYLIIYWEGLLITPLFCSYGNWLWPYEIII